MYIVKSTQNYAYISNCLDMVTRFEKFLSRFDKITRKLNLENPSADDVERLTKYIDTSKYENVTKIFISLPKHKKIPDIVYELEKLNAVHLYMPEITNLKEIKNVETLNILEIYLNDLNISQLNFIKELKNLNCLQINTKHLIIDDIIYSDTLKFLSITANKLEDIQKIIDNLKNLQALHIYVGQVFFNQISSNKIHTLNINTVYESKIELKLPNLKKIQLNTNTKYDKDYFTNFPKLYSIKINGISNDMIFSNKIEHLEIKNGILNNFEIDAPNLSLLTIENTTVKSINIKSNKLNKININENKNIKEFKGDFENLTNLILRYNNINIFDVKAPNLKILDLSGNNLYFFPKCIYNMIELEKLALSRNNFTNISHEIGNLTNLRLFYLENMDDIIFPFTFTDLINLKDFLYDGKLNTVLLEFLNNETNFQKLIKDAQNTHDTVVQHHITDNIKRLMKNDIIINDIYEEVNKLFNEIMIDTIKYNFTVGTIHANTGLTYKDIFTLVINEALIVSKNNEELLKEIIKVMSQEIYEAKSKCFVGNVNSLVNSLNGFTEKITMGLNNTDAIYAIIKVNMKHGKDKVIIELQKAGYDEQVISDWTSAIE